MYNMNCLPLAGVIVADYRREFMSRCQDLVDADAHGHNKESLLAVVMHGVRVLDQIWGVGVSEHENAFAYYCRLSNQRTRT